MAGEDANGCGGGEVLPEAGGPLFEMERLTYDEAYNLVREERLDPRTGQWRDVSLDGPPEPPLWMEYGTCDGAGRVRRVERCDLASGQWRDLSVDRPAPAPDDDDDGPAGAGRWTIAWGDPDLDDSSPDDQPAAAVAPVEPPIPCPACKGVGSIPLLTSRRPCERCGGTGSCKG